MITESATFIIFVTKNMKFLTIILLFWRLFLKSVTFVILVTKKTCNSPGGRPNGFVQVNPLAGEEINSIWLPGSFFAWLHGCLDAWLLGYTVH